MSNRRCGLYRQVLECLSAVPQPAEDIAADLNCSVERVHKAVYYWRGAGLLIVKRRDPERRYRLGYVLGGATLS